LSTTLVKFEENHSTLDEELKKNNHPIVANEVLQPLEERGGRNHCRKQHWVSLPEEKEKENYLSFSYKK